MWESEFHEKYGDETWSEPFKNCFFPPCLALFFSLIHMLKKWHIWDRSKRRGFNLEILREASQMLIVWIVFPIVVSLILKHGWLYLLDLLKILFLLITLILKTCFSGPKHVGLWWIRQASVSFQIVKQQSCAMLLKVRKLEEGVNSTLSCFAFIIFFLSIRILEANQYPKNYWKRGQINSQGSPNASPSLNQQSFKSGNLRLGLFSIRERALK